MMRAEVAKHGKMVSAYAALMLFHKKLMDPNTLDMIYMMYV